MSFVKNKILTKFKVLIFFLDQNYRIYSFKFIFFFFANNLLGDDCVFVGENA